MAPIGLLVACLAPLAYLIWDHWRSFRSSSELDLMVSTAIGFGLVLCIIAAQRYGDEAFRWHVAAVGAILLGWLVHIRQQRGAWRE